MSKYRMQDGTVVDTGNSTMNWSEATDWNGHNEISRATGSQFFHQSLWRSRKGRYYTEHWSDYQNSQSRAEWVSEQEAVRWLTLMGREVPEDLKHLVEEVTE